jgi:hypothetical protein
VKSKLVDLVDFVNFVDYEPKILRKLTTFFSLVESSPTIHNVNAVTAATLHNFAVLAKTITPDIYLT